MMKISIIFIAGILLFVSCENTGSSTVGTYEQDDSSAFLGKDDNAKEETPTGKNAENAYTDTSKTTSGFAEKKDTNSSVEKTTMKAQPATKESSSKP